MWRIGGGDLEQFNGGGGKRELRGGGGLKN